MVVVVLPLEVHVNVAVIIALAPGVSFHVTETLELVVDPEIAPFVALHRTVHPDGMVTL